MREEVTQGYCHASLAGLRSDCRQFIDRINADATAIINRLWPKFGLDLEYEAKLLVSS